MNIYQNGEFSKNLHKLTKYQSLAATVNDMSKQSLYAQKVNEYKNKLDKIGSVQTGGELNPGNKTLLTTITDRIQSLVPKEYEIEYKKLKSAHSSLLGYLENIQRKITSIIEERNAALAAQQEADANFKKALGEAAKKNTALQGLQADYETVTDEKKALARRLAGMNTSDAEYATLMGQLRAAQLRIADLEGQAALNDSSLHQTLNAQLTGKIAGLEAELAKARVELGNKPPTGSQNCDAEIQGILSQIDAALKVRTDMTGPSNDGIMNDLSGIAQSVLDKLSRIGSA